VVQLPSEIWRFSTILSFDKGFSLAVNTIQRFTCQVSRSSHGQGCSPRTNRSARSWCSKFSTNNGRGRVGERLVKNYPLRRTKDGTIAGRSIGRRRAVHFAAEATDQFKNPISAAAYSTLG
jgi:hypothetical protein